MGVASDAAGAGTSSFIGSVLSGGFTSEEEEEEDVEDVVAGTDFCAGCEDRWTLCFSFAGEA